jgi:eukaryotic-like serine/threonine-protein kinase
MKPPRRLTNDDAYNSPTAWTADSRSVLFESNRNSSAGIFKQEITRETPDAVFIAPQLDSFSLLSRLSPDGKWILFVETARTASNPASVSRLMRIPAGGGVPQFVMDTPNWETTDCTRAPSDLCLVDESSPDRTHLIVTAFDPMKGRGKVLLTMGYDPDYSTPPSPDGSMLAIARSGEAEIHIRFHSLSDGSEREITLAGWPNLAGIDWASDGKGLYCGSLSQEGTTLLYVDLKGNARVLWQLREGRRAIWGIPSPDGRYLAILGVATKSHVWMLEGF